MKKPNGKIELENTSFSQSEPFTLIAGPCQLESLAHARMIAEKILEACLPTQTQCVFKSSFDKANRSSMSSTRGLGIDEGLKILDHIRSEFKIPVTTDVHLPDHCEATASVCDILQIPAFLCRQTDLLLAAAKTGKTINVKKGQFLAPWDMVNVVDKILTTDNANILLTDRGTSFGYNTLVTDFRGLVTMAKTGCPVVFDATHSVQQPGGQGSTSGGQREFVPVLAKAACAISVSAVFIETHEDPDNAPSDGPNMVFLNELESLIGDLSKFDRIAKNI